MSEEGNLLYPVFLRLDRIHILIVGGGFVGQEKIDSIFRNSPNANVTLVAPDIKRKIRELALNYPNLKLIYENFSEEHLKDKDVVIAATADNELNKAVYQAAKKQKIIVNVADTPDICDFYMCSIVKKGDLKIGISSNGKSPTLTKRVREMLEEVLPDKIDVLLQKLNKIRDDLKDDFEYKVKKLDELTSVFKEKKNK